jgi:phosphohistidine phosphatase SixA
MTADRLYLIRHAKAGSRDRWTEDDRLRPLSAKGRRQAEKLAEGFRDVEVQRILSSPFVRCVQTVRPLALAWGLKVEEHEALAEGADPREALALLEETPGPAVLCSQGDVIPAVIEALESIGTSLEGEVDWKKGSIWVLEREGPRFVRARYVPPPPKGTIAPG